MSYLTINFARTGYFPAGDDKKSYIQKILHMDAQMSGQSVNHHR